VNQDQPPSRSGRQLTPELFDHYLARAREERAKAIAEFGGHVAAWLTGIASRMTRRRSPANPRCGAGTRIAP
jgi:hypothetical protein